MVDDAAIEAFARDGVVVVRGILSPSEIELLAAGVDWALAHPSERAIVASSTGDPGRFVEDFIRWPEISEIEEIAMQSAIPEAAATLLDSLSARFYHEHVLVKEPGNSSATPWHQDLPYYCLDGSQTVSIWVPLDPVSKEVCPHFLAGSHQGQATYVPRRFKTLAPLEGDTSTYQPFPEIDEARDVDRLRSFDLEPGDAIAFDYHTLHNAPPNQTGTRRRAVSLRYIGEDVRFVDRPHELSPPFTDMGLSLKMGDPLPEDWFPTVWRAN